MEPLAFDGRKLAGVLLAERRLRGWSSRELARRAGVSQSYVIALERAARPGAVSAEARVPTIAVLVELAEALQWTPMTLLARCLSFAQRHALLVYDRGIDPVAAAQSAITAGGFVAPDGWLATSVSPLTTHRIDLHPSAANQAADLAPYDPVAIANALSEELTARAGSIGITGLVVTQQSAALGRSSEAPVVLDFERRWPDIVARQAAATDLCITWNVCAYLSDDVVQASSNVVTEALVATHDLIWFADTHGVIADGDATDRILHLSWKGTS
jgi:hypothetical protein